MLFSLQHVGINGGSDAKVRCSGGWSFRAGDISICGEDGELDVIALFVHMTCVYFWHCAWTPKT